MEASSAKCQAAPLPQASGLPFDLAVTTVNVLETVVIHMLSSSPKPLLLPSYLQ